MQYVIFKEFGKCKVTTIDNYHGNVVDANKIMDFSFFTDVEEIFNYLQLYRGIRRGDIIDMTGNDHG